MLILLHSDRAEVQKASPGELGLLAGFFGRLEENLLPGRDHDLYVHPYFLPGFVPWVRRLVPEARLVDLRVRPSLRACGLPDGLREYQRRGVEAFLEATRGIIKLPTGAGKTLIALTVARMEPCRWLFVTHRRSVMLQARKQFAAAQMPRELGGAHPGVATTTFAALARGLQDGDTALRERLTQVEGVIVDECHAVPARSHVRVLMQLKRAYWRLGLSATPLDRSDEQDAFTVGLLGPVLDEAGIPELQAQGFLARGHVEFHPFVHADDPSSRDWRATYTQAVVDNAARNDLLARLVATASKPCMAFVQEVAHGEALTPRVAARGVRTRFLCGKHGDQARHQALADLRSGQLEALVCTAIFDAGIDLPDLRSVVNGAGMKAVVPTLQRVGRALRPAEGKPGFEMHEVWDEGVPALERHAAARAEAYAERGLDVRAPRVREPVARPGVPAPEPPKADDGSGWWLLFVLVVLALLFAAAAAK